jgi:hypothetical protein
MSIKQILLLVCTIALPWLDHAHADSDQSEPKWPDSVTVKGQILEGQISRLDAGGIVFGTAFGRGTIIIDYGDITLISSGRPFRVYHGKDVVTEGYIMGIENQALIVGQPDGDTASIPKESIVTGLPVADYQASALRRLRTDFRHWNASLNLGWKYEETTIDKNKINFGLGLKRRKRPTRLVFEFDYAYEIQRSNEQEFTTKDELSTYLLGEYDWAANWIVFGRMAMDRDKPRRIDKRYYSATGLGYRFYEDRNHLLQIPVGIGYVDETFIGFGENSYTSYYFGFEGLYTFSNGVKLTGNLLYMPEISDPGDDWLLRFNVDVRMPIVEPIALLLRLTNVNDNNPAPGVGENKLTTLMAIMLDF